jgi:tetrahydromethanopterin S-methyltransferase subunit F
MNRGNCRVDEAMRAEIEKIVEDIKQSVGLLRRHL